MPVTLTIHKRRDRTGNLYAARLVGRRLAVPQRYTEVEDDGDGFCFGAVVSVACVYFAPAVFLVRPARASQ